MLFLRFVLYALVQIPKTLTTIANMVACVLKNIDNAIHTFSLFDASAPPRDTRGSGTKKSASNQSVAYVEGLPFRQLKPPDGQR